MQQIAFHVFFRIHHGLLYHITGSPVGVVTSRSATFGETLCHSLAILPYDARTRFVRSAWDTGESSACVVVEHQPVWLLCLDRMGDRVSPSLDRLSPREPEAPLCHIGGTQSSAPTTRWAGHHSMVPFLGISTCVWDCLFQVVFGRHTRAWGSERYDRGNGKGNSVKGTDVAPVFVPWVVYSPPETWGHSMEGASQSERHDTHRETLHSPRLSPVAYRH